MDRKKRPFIQTKCIPLQTKDIERNTESAIGMMGISRGGAELGFKKVEQGRLAARASDNDHCRLPSLQVNLCPKPEIAGNGKIENFFKYVFYI